MLHGSPIDVRITSPFTPEMPTKDLKIHPPMRFKEAV